MLMVKDLSFEKLKSNIKMINFDNYVNENKTKYNKKLAIYSRSST